MKKIRIIAEIKVGDSATLVDVNRFVFMKLTGERYTDENDILRAIEKIDISSVESVRRDK